MLDYWSSETNPETGLKFDEFLRFMRITHNGNADIDALINSEYGDKFAELLQLRFLYEEDPVGEACLEFLRGYGVKKELFDAEDYYTRWALYTPLNMKEESEKGKKYPLIFYNHGGGCAIEMDEFPHQLPLMVNEEQFILVMAQNTHWDNFVRLRERILAHYPVDPERVYMTGYSQGGQTTDSAVMRVPHLLAGAAPCGSFVFRTYDNRDVMFTLEEAERLQHVFVPIMQMSGACEASNYGTVNFWKPRKDWGIHLRGEYYVHPGRDHMRDPTRINGNMSTMPKPPEGFDPSEWMLGRLNMRMHLLNCEPRDAAKCIAYLNTPEDKIHHMLGFYGDREYAPKYYGLEHYTIDIYNRDGLNAFRFTSVENCMHWPPVMMGPLVWAFLKQFRRDAVTGKIVADEYKA